MNAECTIKYDALKEGSIYDSQSEYLEGTRIADNELSSEFQGHVHTKKKPKECKTDKGTLRERLVGVFINARRRLRIKALSLIRYCEDGKPNAVALRNLDSKKETCNYLADSDVEGTGDIGNCAIDGADALEEHGKEELFVNGSCEFHGSGICFCVNDWSDTLEENDEEEAFVKDLEDNELSSDFDCESLYDSVIDGSDVLAEDEQEEAICQGFEDHAYSSDFRGDLFTVVKTVMECKDEESYNKEVTFASQTNDGQGGDKHDFSEHDTEGKEAISDNDISSDCLGDIYCLGDRRECQDGKGLHVETGGLCEMTRETSVFKLDGKEIRIKIDDSTSTSGSAKTKTDTAHSQTLIKPLNPNIGVFGTAKVGTLKFEGPTALYSVCGKRFVIQNLENQLVFVERLHGHQTLQVFANPIAHFCISTLDQGCYPNTVATRMDPHSEVPHSLASYGFQTLQPGQFLTIVHFFETGIKAFLVLHSPLPSEAASVGSIWFIFLCHGNQIQSLQNSCITCSALITKVESITVDNDISSGIQRMHETYPDCIIRHCLPYDDLNDDFGCLIGCLKAIISLLLQRHASNRIEARSLNLFLTCPGEKETEHTNCSYAIVYDGRHSSLSWQRFTRSCDVDHNCLPIDGGISTSEPGEVERGSVYCVQVGDRNELLCEGSNESTDIQILKTETDAVQYSREMYTADRILHVDNATQQLCGGGQELKMQWPDGTFKACRCQQRSYCECAAVSFCGQQIHIFASNTILVQCGRENVAYIVSPRYLMNKSITDALSEARNFEDIQYRSPYRMAVKVNLSLSEILHHKYHARVYQFSNREEQGRGIDRNLATRTDENIELGGTVPIVPGYSVLKPNASCLHPPAVDAISAESASMATPTFPPDADVIRESEVTLQHVSAKLCHWNIPEQTSDGSDLEYDTTPVFDGLGDAGCVSVRGYNWLLMENLKDVEPVADVDEESTQNNCNQTRRESVDVTDRYPVQVSGVDDEACKLGICDNVLSTQASNMQSYVADDCCPYMPGQTDGHRCMFDRRARQTFFEHKLASSCLRLALSDAGFRFVHGSSDGSYTFTLDAEKYDETYLQANDVKKFIENELYRRIEGIEVLGGIYISEPNDVDIVVTMCVYWRDS